MFSVIRTTRMQDGEIENTGFSARIRLRSNKKNYSL